MNTNRSPLTPEERERRIQLVSEWEAFRKGNPDKPGPIRKLFAQEHGLEYNEFIKVIHWHHEAMVRRAVKPSSAFVKVCKDQDKTRSGNGMAAVLRMKNSSLEIMDDGSPAMISLIFRALGEANAL